MTNTNSYVRIKVHLTLKEKLKYSYSKKLKEDKILDELKTVNCAQLMTTPMKPIEFCIDGMLSTGLFILAGAPKVGKSWLALDMALSIAKGEKVPGRETKRGTALYLCLENSYTRIQNRLFELTSEPSENQHFAIMAGTLGGVLEKQIEQFKTQHTDLKIIIIRFV